jgi:hypothetical protein
MLLTLMGNEVERLAVLGKAAQVGQLAAQWTRYWHVSGLVVV